MTDKQQTFSGILLEPELCKIERIVHRKRLSGEYKKENYLPDLNNYFHTKDKKLIEV